MHNHRIRFLFVALLAVAIVVPTLGQRSHPLRESEITEADREHWAFRPLIRPQAPHVKDNGQVRNPIDQFILAKLEAEGLQMMPQAGRVTLIRRLCFGLTGLPPSQKQVQDFVNDKSMDAYEKLVDRLLASPAYGERWAQHWLDLARFAETDGFEHDKVRKNAWRYRDWVIDALNRDVPYDEFLSLQLAGDEIAPDKNGTHVATGFLVSGPDMPDINLNSERRHVVLNEMTSTVGSVFMGLTMECAQCHNHRFDPVSQADFYRLRAFFANTLPGLKRYKQLPASINEPGAKAPETHFMIRGDFRREGPVLEPAFLRVANPEKQTVADANPQAPSSMRRTALAKWLTQPDHPLTSRVMVNRIWMHHFGKGLSNTPSDFGAKGDVPTHPKLLDWLATEFIRMDWSMKKLHKLIVTSAAYRQASHPSDPCWSEETHKQAIDNWKNAKAKDPDNKLLSRMNRVRLEGEAIRDAMLMAAGKLSPRKGGPGVRPPLPKELVATLLKNQWKVSSNEEDHRRRSIYIFARRNLRFPIFEAFDRPDGNASCSRRTVSTTAPQALILLNSKFSNEMAQTVAENVAKQTNEPSKQIQLCYQTILLRQPTGMERKTGESFLQKQCKLIAVGEQASLQKARQSAVADFCLALFNVNEFVYVD